MELARTGVNNMDSAIDWDYIQKKLPFFAFLKVDEQKRLIESIRLLSYKKGECISEQGNNCTGLIVIKKGSIRTYILSEEGREITLYRLEEGDVCVMSTSCVLNAISFDLQIESETDAEVYSIPQSVIHQLSANIHVENFLLKGIAERFSDVMWTMEQLLFYNLNKRLAMFLLDEMNRNQCDTIYITHETIAKYLGTAREVISKRLKRFANDGLIELTRGRIRVRDKQGLKHLI